MNENEGPCTICRSVDTRPCVRCRTSVCAEHQKCNARRAFGVRRDVESAACDLIESGLTFVQGVTLALGVRDLLRQEGLWPITVSGPEADGSVRLDRGDDLRRVSPNSPGGIFL